MYVLTADEIRQVENNCFDGYSTEAQLMLKAGTACYDAVMKNYGTDIFSKRILVIFIRKQILLHQLKKN